MAKVPGLENGADLMTKHKGRPELIQHLKRLGFFDCYVLPPTGKRFIFGVMSLLWPNGAK